MTTWRLSGRRSESGQRPSTQLLPLVVGRRPANVWECTLRFWEEGRRGDGFRRLVTVESEQARNKSLCTRG